MNENGKSTTITNMVLVVLLVSGLLGVGVGYALAKKVTMNSSMGITSSKSVVASSKEAGLNDDSAFPDVATGVLQPGGTAGEGTHHLDRGMGANKDVYLTSTVINLDNFVGKKVEVHGQTISGKKAGWLMDVGKIKVIE